jgi:NADH-quinone oxidoreductase subunit M
MLLFLAFFAAFAIKVPIFPLHTWLPDAHVEAPVAGSVMLASVMLKMGTYGILHFCLPLFPSAARTCAPWIVVLAIIGIVYGALVAMVQPNMKKLVAYSSVSHLGFVVLGIFTFTQMGLDGAVYQMLNHGISTGALFVFVGLLYERRHSLEIADYGGVATAAPWLATAFLVTTLASIGLPMLNNFVGEFLVLQGAAIANFKWAIYAAIGVILSGTGTDGTSGLRAIKEHGGLTLAQAPETARYESMPESAIAAGLVDAVLPVEQMPARLVVYAEHLADLRHHEAHALDSHVVAHLPDRKSVV